MTDIDIVERLRKTTDGETVNPDGLEAADEIETLRLRVAALEATVHHTIDESNRLRKYEALVRFIANDYHELSYEKAQWQRDDWKKRCQKLIAEDWKE